MKLHYKLLTPGPLTTTDSVKNAMLVDHCTWDDDYKHITQEIRTALLQLADVAETDYSCVLMQGSGSFGVESVISSAFAPNDQVLVLSNGAYGERIVAMMRRANVDIQVYSVEYNQTFSADTVEKYLQNDDVISHIMMVHCETTTGILNDIESVGKVAKQYGKGFIVDAMSSFGGMSIPMQDWHIDCLISSANKCIQGVPGFAFVIASHAFLQASQGRARTVSLDLYDQWQGMNLDGKWRFTSPTHTVLAFRQALRELADEGGIVARHQRYQNNNRIMREGLAKWGIQAYIAEEWQSPFISTFLFPEKPFSFARLYAYVKERGYAIYPGKLTNIDTFRLGNIGDIHAEDAQRVVAIIGDYLQTEKC